MKTAAIIKQIALPFTNLQREESVSFNCFQKGEEPFPEFVLVQEFRCFCGFILQAEFGSLFQLRKGHGFGVDATHKVEELHALSRFGLVCCQEMSIYWDFKRSLRIAVDKAPLLFGWFSLSFIPFISSSMGCRTSWLCRLQNVRR